MSLFRFQMWFLKKKTQKFLIKLSLSTRIVTSGVIPPVIVPPELSSSLHGSQPRTQLKAPGWLAPYVKRAGGRVVEAWWSCHWGSGTFPEPDPPRLGTRGRGGVKTWRAFAWSPWAGNHLLPHPHPAGHLWSHQIWAKTRMMTEAFHLLSRRQSGRELVHGTGWECYRSFCQWIAKGKRNAR